MQVARTWRTIPARRREHGHLREIKAASTADVLISIGSTLVLLMTSVALFGSDSSQGANQIALVFGAAIAAVIGIKNGHSWKVVERTIVGGIATAMPAILILLSVGSLIGAWILSGTVPSMIYYGLLLLNPTVFYAACCLMCAITALAIGSSWTVAGTLGIALVGIAAGMGLSPAITAGAIISGAYFGDKMSPLSDTTNLAPAVTGIDIFTHIRHMSWTTGPSLAFALVAFTFIGLQGAWSDEQLGLGATLALLEANFHISVLHLIPVFLVAGLAMRKTPAVATILIGALVGVLFALAFQRPAILALAGDGAQGDAADLAKGVWIVLFGGYSANTGDANLDSLLSRGGMSSMLTTVWLILTAMAFGAGLEKAGILETLLRNLLKLARSAASLIATTAGTCLSVNVLAADQFMAIVLPGRMFKDEFRRRGLHEKNLARVLEDTGTITSPLVPWNTCGAYMAATLGVPTLLYLPFCFFNLVNPLVSVAYGATGFKIAPMEPDEVDSGTGGKAQRADVGALP